MIVSVDNVCSEGLRCTVQFKGEWNLFFILIAMEKRNFFQMFNYTNGNITLILIATRFIINILNFQIFL